MMRRYDMTKRTEIWGGDEGYETMMDGWTSEPATELARKIGPPQRKLPFVFLSLIYDTSLIFAVILMITIVYGCHPSHPFKLPEDNNNLEVSLICLPKRPINMSCLDFTIPPPPSLVLYE